jgi:hypothetical protein
MTLKKTWVHKHSFFFKKKTIQKRSKMILYISKGVDEVDEEKNLEEEAETISIV